MASNVESGFYWMGFGAGMHGKRWDSVPFPPGTRAFHQWLEGRADGLKAHILQKRGHYTHRGAHHAHGHHAY
jgi:hypothetical protein